MPMHDWTKVPAGIFHAFHHRWISAISDSLNSGLLPSDYYALPEQQAAGFGPDVLTLQNPGVVRSDEPAEPGGAATLPARPKTRFTAESEVEFYRRKKSSVVVRHIRGDWIVAMIEIVSPEEMPLFLEPGGCVLVPLEATYQTAFDVQPARWRNVLLPPEETSQ
jgi:hypothetical protein